MPSCSRIAATVSANDMPARDLLVQEEPDHLALVVRLHLLAGDHDQVAPARLLDRLEGAAEDVVVGDRDRAEALRLGVVEQLVHLDRAVVRPATCACAGRRGSRAGRRAARRRAARAPPAAAEAAVDLVELLRDRGEALVLGASRAPRGLGARAAPSSSASRCERRGGELGLLEARPADRPAPRRRPPPRAAGGRSRSGPGRRSRPPRGSAARACGRRPERTCTRSRSASGIPGRVDSGFVRSEHRLPAGQVAQRAERSAGDGQRAGVELDHDQLPLLAGREEARCRRPARHDAIVAGEALGGRRGGRLGGGEQRVDAGEQLLAQRAPRRIAEPLGREEASRRRAPPSRAARGTRCSAAPARSRGRRRSGPAGARGGGSRGRRPGRRGWTGATRARLRRSRSRRRRSPRASARRPADQVGRRAGRSEHGDRVPERAQLLRDPGDVLVDVVRL